MAQARPYRSSQRGDRDRQTRGYRTAGDSAATAAPRTWGPGRIAEIQRARIVTATFEAAADLGAGNVSVADIVARSGVSRRTFYEAFNDREDCLACAFEHALACASRRVLPAYQAQDSWREQIRAGLSTLLAFFDEQPKMARFLLLDSHACGANVAECRAEITKRLVATVAQGRAETRTNTEPPPLVAEGAVGGVLSILQSAIAAPAHEPLVNLTNPLMGTIVLPYLGAAAARRELDRPVQSANTQQDTLTPAVDPFKHAGLRLTYRTVRVLLAIAEMTDTLGAPSNRQIGNRAGIADQGQISKLLRRLRRAGLIENASVGPAGQGAPNAWTLTQTGRRMTDGFAAHTTDTTTDTHRSRKQTATGGTD